MGNSTPQSNKQNQKRLSRINHPILQFAYQINNKEMTELELIIATPNENTSKLWQQKIKKYRIPYLDSQVLFLPKSIQYEGAALCGSGGIIKAIYNAPPLLLSQQLENRISLKQPFYQPQIWYLLFVLIYAASQIHNKDLIIGDIRPKNIFLFQNGEISLSCLASFLQETPNYIKSLRNKQPTFLAPEQIDDLVNHKIEDNDPQTSQNFSIGLTLLGLMLLHDQQKLFFLSQNIFQVQKFAKQLSSLASCEIYSVELKKIVLSLLQAQITLRINSYQVLKILKPYSQKILNFEDFSLNFNTLDQEALSKLNAIKFSDYKLGSSSTIMRRINQIQRLDGRLSVSTPLLCQKDYDKQEKMMNMSKITPKLSSLMIVPGIQDHLFTPSNYKSDFNANENKKQQLLLKPNQLIHDQDSSNCNQSQYDNKNKQKNFIPGYKTTKIQLRNFNRGSKSVQNYNLDQDEENYIETKSNLDQNNKIKSIIKQERQNFDNSQDSGNAIKQQYNFTYTFRKRQQNILDNVRKLSTPVQISAQKTMERQTNQTDNRSENMFKDFKKLEEMGRQAKSIRNPKIAKRPHLKIDYEMILKNIDQQVKCSREKFPNQSHND